MKTIRNVTVYRCDYCNRASVSKGAMTLHERKCMKRPEYKRLCYDCMNFHYQYPETEEEAENERPCEIDVRIKVGDLSYTEPDTGYTEKVFRDVVMHMLNYQCSKDGRHMFSPNRMSKETVA